MRPQSIRTWRGNRIDLKSILLCDFRSLVPATGLPTSALFVDAGAHSAPQFKRLLARLEAQPIDATPTAIRTLDARRLAATVPASAQRQRKTALIGQEAAGRCYRNQVSKAALRKALKRLRLALADEGEHLGRRHEAPRIVQSTSKS